MGADGAERRGIALAWAIFVFVAGAMALLAVLEWAEALASGRPILYGEGPVAHAALLMRTGQAYSDTTGTVAANYPPLYLLAASLGDPFRVGRAVTIASAVAVALVVAWRARGGGRLVAVSLGLAWLALAPVAIWGAAIKPDLFSVALTLAGVALLDRGPRASPYGGALLGLAVWAKPTEILPAVAVLGWLALTDRPRFVRSAAASLVIGVIAVVHARLLGLDDVWRHVIAWNVLPWSAEQTGLVLVLGLATLGIVLVVATMAGAFRGLTLAYVLGALAVVALAGREGATINYLLDLAAAISYGLATIAARLRGSAALPVAATVQLAIAVALLTPFGIVPGRAPTTGAWGQPERGEVVHALGPGRHLVEDSGLLIADGKEPVVDDLFLWSRLARSGAIDPSSVIADARRGAFASVVSEADLAALDRAPAYERARWEPTLVAAILERYTLDHSTGVLWVYRPR